MNKRMMLVPAILIILAMSSSALAAGNDSPNISQNFTLKIFGNANMDNTIDRKDIAYVEDVINKTKAPTNFSDANYDGRIDDKDVDQIEKIIQGNDQEITVLDSSGRTVRINKPVNRVIALVEYQAEAMRILGSTDKIAGITGTVKEDGIYFPEISKLPSVGTYPGDLEAILSLNPDLILGWQYKSYDDLLRKMENSSGSKIPVISMLGYVPDNGQMIEELLKLGYIMNRRDEAERYVDGFYNKHMNHILTRVAGLSEGDKPGVYTGGNLGKGLYFRFPSGSTTSMLIKMCGGRDILSDLKPGGSELDPEAIISRNPDIIVQDIKKADAGYEYDNVSNLKSLWNETISRPELANIKAVQNRDVYIIDNGLGFGYDLPVAMAYYAKWLHPDIFKDLDPMAVHQEFLTDFQRLDYDLNKHGAFVYNPDKNPNGVKRNIVK